MRRLEEIARRATEYNPQHRYGNVKEMLGDLESYIVMRSNVLAYECSDKDRGEFGINIINQDGSEKRKLLKSNYRIELVGWSPDGNYIFVKNSWSAFRFDLRGPSLSKPGKEGLEETANEKDKRVYEHIEIAMPLIKLPEGTEAAMSPKGDKIAFIPHFYHEFDPEYFDCDGPEWDLAHEALLVDCNDYGRMFLIELKEKTIELVVDTMDWLQSLAWSPDGTCIAYTRTPKYGDDPLSNSFLEVVNTDSGRNETIADDALSGKIMWKPLENQPRKD